MDCSQSDSRMWLEQSRLEEERQLFEQQRENFRRERQKFIDTIRQLEKEVRNSGGLRSVGVTMYLP